MAEPVISVLTDALCSTTIDGAVADLMERLGIKTGDVASQVLEGRDAE